MTTTVAPQLKTITSSELRALVEASADVRLLDVRTSGEFETAHIPGSCNVPLDSIGDYAGDITAIADPVVVVCQSGARATQACRKLNDAGGESFKVLEGGVAAWETAGGDVIRGENARWALERQVRLVAGSLVLASVLTSVAVPKAKFLAGGVGFGLVFSAVSNTCAMGTVLSKLPYNRAAGCDVDAAITELGAPASRV